MCIYVHLFLFVYRHTKRNKQYMNHTATAYSSRLAGPGRRRLGWSGRRCCYRCCCRCMWFYDYICIFIYFLIHIYYCVIKYVHMNI